MPAAATTRGAATIGTYNGLYPRLPYFAETAMLVPSNLYDVRPVVDFRPLADVVVVAGWDTLWRTSTRDALYGSGMVPYPRGRRRRRAPGSAPKPRSTSAGGPTRT